VLIRGVRRFGIERAKELPDGVRELVLGRPDLLGLPLKRGQRVDVPEIIARWLIIGGYAEAAPPRESADEAGA
jgi:hypothetical protein